MTNKEQNNLSKYIALILRHRPDVIGITLDEHGWANVSDLLNGINKTQTITMKMLQNWIITNCIRLHMAMQSLFRIDLIQES